jgi:16S rRNA (cytidine1402-2'-O)-methyltransferase
MTNKGRLVLIPNTISEAVTEEIVTPQLRQYLPGIQFFLAENVRTARRFLSSLKIYPSIEPLSFSVLDKDTEQSEIKKLMNPLHLGHDLGVISESGCPGIADPGSAAVLYAHQNGFRVVPLVGPSSILLALMASGLNGQNFAFHGYLPIDKSDFSKAVKNFENESRKKSQTQIFIETPYRNNQTLKQLLTHLSLDSLLTIAIDLTGPSEMVLTKKVREWNSSVPLLEKSPAVFLFLTTS